MNAAEKKAAFDAQQAKLDGIKMRLLRVKANSSDRDVLDVVEIALGLLRIIDIDVDHMKKLMRIE